MEMVLPRNHVAIEQEEMMYLDGGTWSMRTVGQNAVGLTGMAGLGWVGNELLKFYRANRNMSFGQAALKLGSTALRAFWALPLWAKAVTAATGAAMVYTLGKWTIF